MHKWEIPATKIEELGTYDIGIVLGGMSSYDTDYNRTQFQRGVDRLLQAIDLYKKGKIKKIFFVGGSGRILHPELKEGPLVKKYLLTIGIPESDLIVETESNNTRENALFTKAILDKDGIHGKYLLITSAFHMRRSMGCYKKAGIEATPYSTDRFSGGRKFEFDHVFIPSIDALDAWTAFIHEVIGFCVYKTVGYA